MKILVTHDIIVKGKPVSAGTPIDVDGETATLLLRMGRAEHYKAPLTPPQPKQTTTSKNERT